MAVNLQDRLNRWEVLNANFKNHLESLPDMKPKQEEFEQLISQDLALAAQYNQLVGTARNLILQRRAVAKKGNQLRNILVAALRHNFGPDNLQLTEFGVKPRIARKKKKEDGKKPAPAEPTVSKAAADSAAPDA